MKKSPLILLCRCSKSEALPDDPRRQILGALAAQGIRFANLEDLCGLAARKDPELQALAEKHELKIIACQPRAITWLLQSAGIPRESAVEIFNAGTETPDAIVSRLPPTAEKGETITIGKRDGWIPWFPVIDYDLCVNCKKCLSFCLFGVYALDAKGVVSVTNPEGCKTNCPACARVCPKAAIMFPKFPDAPINGAPVTKDSVEAIHKVDLEKALGSNIYQALADRKNKPRPTLLRKNPFLPFGKPPSPTEDPKE